MSLPAAVKELAAAFQAAGQELYVVGGAVRDAVLGLDPKDIDLATGATPEQIRPIVQPLGHPIMEVGEAFGVIALVLPAPLEKLEIATFREDLTAGRHPTVRFSNIFEDVKRRDLTINALFYDITAGEVVDLVGGLEDLERGVIRAVGNPKERFKEDKLRVMRAIRFASRFGWQIDDSTSSALWRHDLDGVSPERIRDELVRALASAADPKQVLSLMSEHGLWNSALPGLQIGSGIPSRSVPVVLASLLSGNARIATCKVLKSLKYSDREIRSTGALMDLRTFTGNNPSSLRKQIQNSGLKLAELQEFVMNTGISLDRNVMAFVEYLDSDPVKGDELLVLGYSGKGLGMEMERRELELFQGLVGA